MMRTNPFEDVDRLFEQMHRRMGGFDSPFEGVGGVPVDVAQVDDVVVVTADVPGFETEDFDLTVSEDTLTISAEREAAADVDEDVYVRRERSARSIRRSVRLPAAVDESGASASYTNGVLTVTLPTVGADESGHRIDVE